MAVLDRLRACSFLGTWRALLCGELIRFGAAGGDLQCFFQLEGGPWKIIFRSEVQATRPLFLRSQADLKRTCRRGWLEVIGCQGQSIVEERHGAKSSTARNSAKRLVANAIGNRPDPRFLDIVYPSSFIDYKCGMPISKGM